MGTNYDAGCTNRISLKASQTICRHVEEVKGKTKYLSKVSFIEIKPRFQRWCWLKSQVWIAWITCWKQPAKTIIHRHWDMMFLPIFSDRPLVARAVDDGNFDLIVDSRLPWDYNHSEMARMVSCAALCVWHLARRVAKMSQVVRALEGDSSLSDVAKCIKPWHNSAYNSSSDYNGLCSKLEFDATGYSVIHILASLKEMTFHILWLQNCYVCILNSGHGDLYGAEE